MEEAGLDARATKDLDIVLCLEALDPGFVATFWEFVRLGGYQQQERGEGQRSFYRFQKPTDPAYPAMLELFSRKPDVLTIAEGQHLVPIPIGGEMESLSAILLDDDYYTFLHGRKRLVQGVSVVDPIGLIALKAYAWCQLSAEKEAGAAVSSKNISKHRSDVLRLYALVQLEERVPVPAQIQHHIRTFLGALDLNLDLAPFGLVGVRVEELARNLRSIYEIVETAA
jgi:hypothetical protein